MPNRIDTKFGELRRAGRPALIPFVTVGFPDVETSVDIARAIVAAGGDLLELGVPFSDPLADGSTIQRASFQALRNGVTVQTCLDAVRRIRAAGVEAPLIFMGYYNPFLRYGVPEFARAAADAGLDGLIVADLPTEEASPLREACEAQGVHLLPLLAPTSSDARMAQACQRARGFIYCVSLTGVTGARSELASGLAGLVGRIRRHTDLPVVVGFGVSRREHLQTIAGFADGAVVASALLDAVGSVPTTMAVQAATEFVKGLTVPQG